MRRLLPALLATCLLLVAVAASANASAPLEVKIVDGQLVARVQVTLVLDVTCQPLANPYGEPITAAIWGAGATVDQAAGRSIAHAEGGDLMVSMDHPITCDGSTVTRLSIPMVSSTVPFHGGKAVATVGFNVDNPGCMFCGYSQHVDITGTVKLR